MRDASCGRAPFAGSWSSTAELPGITNEEALKSLGDDAIYYATKLRGASNATAKATFGLKPRRLEWLAK